MNAKLLQMEIGTPEQLRGFVAEAERARSITLAASFLASLPRKPERKWTGYLDGKTRLWRGRKVLLPDGRVAQVYGCIRGKVGVFWPDDFSLTGQGRAVFKASQIRLLRLPAAVLLGAQKRGVAERKSPLKAAACRRNGGLPPRPGSRPRGRPRKAQIHVGEV
ncbi:MAG: hypothetical protein ACYDH9_23740 [Limisphaerales bacterium]